MMWSEPGFLVPANGSLRKLIHSPTSHHHCKPFGSPSITDQMQYNGFKCEINEMLLKRRNTRQILFFVSERDTSHHYTEANKTKFKAYYRCPQRGSTIGFWLKFRYLLLDITYYQWPPMWKSSGQCVRVF